MDDGSARQYARFVRVRDFAQTNITDAAGTDAAAHLAKIVLIVAGLEKKKSTQAHGSATPRNVLIAALHHDEEDLSRTAGAIGQEVLGFEQFFKLPTQRNPASILTAADIMLGNLIADPTDDAPTQAAKADRQTRFIAHGFASDFATTMQTHRGQIDDFKTTRDNEDSTGEESTAAIGTLVADGIKECVFLDAIFHNLYRDKADKMAGWVSAHHTERAPVSAATKAKQAAAKAAKKSGGTTTNPTP